MRLGLVGLPNVGKSTLFNAITMAGAECANYPFCTIEPNVGVVPVPDERLNKLAEMFNSERIVHATIEFVDIAGLVKGASKGEGLGNRFLSHIREVDAIIHVVRCFEDENVVHVNGSANPVRDAETINIELALADLEMAENRKNKALKLIKGDKKYAAEVEFLDRLIKHLEEGLPAGTMSLNDAEKKITDEMFLLTTKPVIYVANIDEDGIADGLNNPMVNELSAHAASEGAETAVICARIEEEIAQLDDEERSMFLDDLGLTQSGLDKLITAGYDLLGLISFLTAGPMEARAWTINRGAKAPQAAGKIHTDFEKGFIRAEIAAYDDLIKYGGYNAVKEKGLVRSEGKEYVMKDGDVTLFRFNV